jgi:epoxyqueuosine reductase QueG
MDNIITERIKNLVSEYEEKNKILELWKEPIVGYIPADNEKFQGLKKSVCSDHLMPRDVLPDAKTVIIYFIPFKENIVKSNIKGEMASTEWAIAYLKTNNLIRIINDDIEKLMAVKKCRVSKISVLHPFDKKNLVSTWSHRHVAYIAGMGAFGINNMLITKNGCCGRFGSIITDYELSEYEQTGETEEKCLNILYGTCGICLSNCVAKCFENHSFDGQKCYVQCLKNKALHKKYGHADVCGKCLVNLPCSTNEPGSPE